MNLSDTQHLITVRKATEADVPVYLQLSADFHKASPMQKVCEFEPKGFEIFLRGAMQNPDMCALLAEVNGEIVGITGGLAYPLYFSPSHKVAQELWWWLTPAARGSGAGNKMFKHLQLWAKERGAKTMFMIALEDERADKMEKVYFRAGFEPMERTFMKGIE
jgi:N-acetylglutamate synthase-like GNAT family acetyltransferase